VRSAAVTGDERSTHGSFPGRVTEDVCGESPFGQQHDDLVATFDAFAHGFDASVSGREGVAESEMRHCILFVMLQSMFAK
jgi:hypothetical protein